MDRRREEEERWREGVEEERWRRGDDEIKASLLLFCR